MKRKVLVVLFFVMTVFLSAEQFKGVLGFNLNDSKENVLSKAKELGYLLKENPNFYSFTFKDKKNYASRNVINIKMAFYEEKLVWMEIDLGRGTIYSSDVSEIIAGITEKYEFEKDLANSSNYYTNYINIDTGVTFNCAEADGVLDIHDIAIKFCYFDQYMLYKKWRDIWLSKEKHKNLDDSI